MLSGLYDLEPLLAETPNEWLNLTKSSTRDLSPSNHSPDPSLPVSVCVGATETDAFLRQSRNYAEVLRGNGNPVEYVESPGKNHMEIILECGAPGTPVFKELERNLAISG